MEGFQDSVFFSELGVTCRTGFCLKYSEKSVTEEFWVMKLKGQCTGSRVEDGLMLRDQKQEDRIREKM